jgi:homocysteine S-methyltransferase
MQFETFLNEADLILAEGSVYERMRRQPDVQFDPYLAHASMIYDPAAAHILEQVHREYVDIGQKYALPIAILTDTWRANLERVNLSRFQGHKVNQANARFLQNLRSQYEQDGSLIFIGGNIGPRGDAYRPEQALSRGEAARFHAYQIQALAEGGVDFLMASTLPAFSEAAGIADAMAATRLPYILSFVIHKHGALLDGTPLNQAIAEIDATVARPSAGYAVNCVHPSILKSSLLHSRLERRSQFNRLVAFQANSSPRSPEELERLTELEGDAPESLADSIWEVRQLFDITILGGCCGTGTQHIECLAKKYRHTM